LCACLVMTSGELRVREAAHDAWRGITSRAERLADPAPDRTLINYIAAHARYPEQAESIARMLTTACERHGGNLDPLMFAVIARYESTLDPASINPSTHCAGLIQIHPLHREAMRDMGLDFDSEPDRLLFGCILFAAQGWKPWSVRGRAKREYQEIRGER